MGIEKNIVTRASAEKQEFKIAIKKSCEAPVNAKNNPFYDEAWWGMAKSPENIYLPESDEAISFAIATHEIGHLTKGELSASLDDFEATKNEELRAWQRGWEYIKKPLEAYCGNDREKAKNIESIIKEVEKIMMEAVDISRPLYQEKGSVPENVSEYQEYLQTRRQKLFDSDIGKEIIKKMDEMKVKVIGVRTDWEKFRQLIEMAVGEILKDNEKK